MLWWVQFWLHIFFIKFLAPVAFNHCHLWSPLLFVWILSFLESPIGVLCVMMIQIRCVISDFMLLRKNVGLELGLVSDLDSEHHEAVPSVVEVCPATIAQIQL